MNPGIQVVDQLRADRGLRKHQLNGCLGIAGVPFQDLDERAILLYRLELLIINKTPLGNRSL